MDSRVRTLDIELQIPRRTGCEHGTTKSTELLATRNLG